VAVKAQVAAGAAPLSGCQVFLEIRTSAGALVTSMQAFTDTNGNAMAKWKTSRGQTGGYRAVVVDVSKSGYQFDPAGSVTSVSFTVQ